MLRMLRTTEIACYVLHAGLRRRSPRWRFRRRRARCNGAADRSGDCAELADEAAELIREQRLSAVRHRAIGIGVHLDDHAVGACRDGGTRHWNDLVAQACAVAW